MRFIVIKIHLLLTLSVLAGNVISMQGMMLQTARPARQLKNIYRPIITKPTQPTKPQPINPSTPQPQEPSEKTVETATTKATATKTIPSSGIRYKEFLAGPSEEENTGLGRHWRNWLRNLKISFISYFAPQTKIVTVISKKSATVIEMEEITKKLHTSNPWGDGILVEQIRILLKKDNPDLFFIQNALLQIPSNLNLPEIDQLKQKFFDKVDTHHDTLKTPLLSYPKNLFTLLPNNLERFIQTIETFYIKLYEFTHTESYHSYLKNKPLKKMDAVDKLQQALVNAIAKRSINDIKQLIIKLLPTNHGQDLIEKLILYQPELKKYVNDLIKQHKNNYLQSKDGIDCLAKTLGSRDFIEAILGIDSSLAEIPSYKHLQKFYLDLNKINEVTILNDPSLSNQIDLIAIVNNPYLINMIQKSMLHEKELINLGYEVFYHGRRWKWGFLSDIYNMLYSYKSQKELKDFIFTNLDDPVLGNISEQFFMSEKTSREQLLKEGNPSSATTHRSLLFLNKFLFGNLNFEFSSSISYMMSNYDQGKLSLSIKEVFNMFGRSDAYQAFEDKLLTLQEDYNKLTRYGELLQIAIPKDTVNKCVYYTTNCGPKISFSKTSYLKHIPCINETTDVKLILKDLDTNPRDETEFALINTRDKFGGLNPESGIKMFSYNAVDPEKWTTFKNKEKDLFNQIKEWMQQKNRKKEQIKMARE